MCAKELGARTETFGKRTGWNFDSPKDRRRFFRELQNEQPDEILLSPPCALWSMLQETSLGASPERKRALCEARHRDHENTLN